MSTTTIENGYAVKIAALLAKAESTDSPAEAEALSAKAEELMLRWGITDAMAAEARAGATATEPVIERRQTQVGTYHKANMLLANSIVRGLGSLRLLQSPGTGDSTHIYVIGHTSDVDRFFLLFDSLKAQAEGAMRQWWRDNREGFRDWDGKVSQQSGFKARRQFVISFGRAVGERLVKERKVAVAETTGSELVLVSRDSRVQQEYERLYPRTRTSRSRLQGSRSGSTAGYAAGQRASLSGSRAVSR